jgi:pimeloyl-ACP methyl ester carboxylesterase
MTQNDAMQNKLGPVLILVGACLLACVSVPAQKVPAAITTDPPSDKSFPAVMEAPDIPSHGSRLNVVFYLAAGANAHPTILLLHGFPGNEQNLDLAYMLQRAGWNVLLIHYRGSWGSSGNFTFANALEDTQAALEFLRDPKNVAKYRVNPSRIVLIGHSMGGFIAAYTAAHDPGISALVMMAAWNIGAVVSRPSFSEHTDTFTSASPRLAGTTPESLIAEAKAHAVEWNYVEYVNQLKTRPVLLLEVNDRNAEDNRALAENLDKAGNSQVTEKYLDTDHIFSDHRIALQIAVLDWLQHLPAPTAK